MLVYLVLFFLIVALFMFIHKVIWKRKWRRRSAEKWLTGNLPASLRGWMRSQAVISRRLRSNLSDELQFVADLVQTCSVGIYKKSMIKVRSYS